MVTLYCIRAGNNYVVTVKWYVSVQCSVVGLVLPVCSGFCRLFWFLFCSFSSLRLARCSLHCWHSLSAWLSMSSIAFDVRLLDVVFLMLRYVSLLASPMISWLSPMTGFWRCLVRIPMKLSSASSFASAHSAWSSGCSFRCTCGFRLICSPAGMQRFCTALFSTVRCFSLHSTISVFSMYDFFKLSSSACRPVSVPLQSGSLVLFSPVGPMY